MNEYHGWIVVKREPGYADTFWIEHDEEQVINNRTPGIADTVSSKRVRRQVESAAMAVEFFDKRVGRPVLLTETPLGAFRVYTEREPEKITISRTKSQNVRANQLRTECQRLVGIVRGGSQIHDGWGDWHDAVKKLCDVAEQLAELTK